MFSRCFLKISFFQLKFEVYDSFSHYKNEVTQNKKLFEDNFNERITIIEKNSDKSIEEFNRHKSRIDEYFDMRKIDQEETLKQTKQILSSYSKDLASETNLLRSEIQKLNMEFTENMNKKLDKKEFDLMKNKFFNDLEKKVNKLFLV